MDSRDVTALGYRRIVLLLVSLVVVPSGLLLALGVVLLFSGEAPVNVLMGILVLALSGAAVTGVILVWVFVRREANLSQLQSDFVSKVSHELRTPLTSIRLFSETLALRGEDRDAASKCIAGLTRETTRLQELIDRLLDWGQMESGRRLYQMRETDLYAIVEEAVAAFEPMREQRGATLTIELPSELPTIYADRGAISDAVLNLLTNACKYGGDPPKIHLGCDVHNEMVRLVVSDNGSGIPVGEHKRIFQKFYRVDDRLSREREGSGLGLAIVNHVAKAHKGRVLVHSTPRAAAGAAGSSGGSDTGFGSQFTLALPVLHGSVKRSERASVEPPLENAARGS